MPGTEMGEQIVFLVEVERTDKAFKCPPANKPAHDSAWKYFDLNSPLLVESLHVCQQQSSLWKCFRALWTLAFFKLIAMLACSVLLILPLHVKNLMAFLTWKAPICVCVLHIQILKWTKTYFCMWNFWCLFSWVREANVLLQMGQRNCIPWVGWEGGSSWRTPLLGLFRLDFNFWRRFLRDRFFFFTPPFPVCNWSWDSDATTESLCTSSTPPRAI